jgi:hypothetical protein
MEKAVKTLPLPRRGFITKHLAEMCRVGKFLVRLKEKRKRNPDVPEMQRHRRP